MQITPQSPLSRWSKLPSVSEGRWLLLAVPRAEAPPSEWQEWLTAATLDFPSGCAAFHHAAVCSTDLNCCSLADEFRSWNEKQWVTATVPGAVGKHATSEWMQSGPQLTPSAEEFQLPKERTINATFLTTSPNNLLQSILFLFPIFCLLKI